VFNVTLYHVRDTALDPYQGSEHARPSCQTRARRLASDRRITWPDTPAIGRNPFKDDDVHVIEASWKVLSSPSRQHHNDLRMRYHGAEHRQIGTNLVSRRLHLDKPTDTAAASFIEVSAVAIQRVLKFPILTRRLNASSQLKGIFSICVSAHDRFTLALFVASSSRWRWDRVPPLLK
jgi:hypothetical protein